MKKNGSFLRRWMRTSIDPALSALQFFAAVGFGLWLLIWPQTALDFLAAVTAVVVLLSAIGSYRSLQEQRRKTRDRLALAGVVCIALLLFFLPHWLAAPTGILFGAWFLLLFLVRGLCAVECWRRDLHGKYRHSTASLLSLLFSILLFASPASRLPAVAVLCGVYLLLYALLLLVDGIAEWLLRRSQHTPLRRRIQLSLPIFLSALLPGKLVDEFNDYFSTRKEGNAGDSLPLFAGREKDTQAEVFIHLVSRGMGRTGHVDFRLGDTVYSYGCYDHHSHRVFGLISDGTLAIAPADLYRQHCLSFERKILIGFGLHLSPEQEQKTRDTLQHLLEQTESWMCDAEKIEKGLLPRDKKAKDAASYLWRATGAQIRKVKEGPFSTYFALNTNCVQLADTILGPAGLDILAVNGIPTPGSYYAMLNRQFESGSPVVVTRTVYAGRLTNGARPKMEKTGSADAKENRKPEKREDIA